MERSELDKIPLDDRSLIEEVRRAYLSSGHSGTIDDADRDFRFAEQGFQSVEQDSRSAVQPLGSRGSIAPKNAVGVVLVVLSCLAVSAFGLFLVVRRHPGVSTSSAALHGHAANTEVDVNNNSSRSDGARAPDTGVSAVGIHPEVRGRAIPGAPEQKTLPAQLQQDYYAVVSALPRDADQLPGASALSGDQGVAFKQYWDQMYYIWCTTTQAPGGDLKSQWDSFYEAKVEDAITHPAYREVFLRMSNQLRSQGGLHDRFVDVIAALYKHATGEELAPTVTH